jgi:DNA-binding LytR/AlgR family response regulator
MSLFIDSSSKERFLIKTGTRLIPVHTSQIAFFYTREKYQYIKTSDNKDLIVGMHLDEIEEKVESSMFFRVNRQFVINYHHIGKVLTWFNGKLKVVMEPASHEDIIVSRLKTADFKKWLGE